VIDALVTRVAMLVLLVVGLSSERSLGGSPLTTKSTDVAGRVEQTINFPDRDDLGTGTIRIDIAAAPRGKPQRVPITTEDFVPLEGPRIYGLSVTISMRQVRIEFRRPSSANPVFAGTFSSSGIFDPLLPHQLDVDFADWKVLSVRMDGELLPMSSGPGKPER
jgi:hypothetical protein